MLTTSELLEIQDSSQGKNPIQIVPILESPKTSKLDGPGIEIKPIQITKKSEPKKGKPCKGLSFKHPDNNGIWFKIRNATNISHLIKIFDNQTIWKQQCTFPCHTVAACYCNGVIIVSLINNTLNFVDTITGCLCLPSILLTSRTKYLQRVDDDKIVLITSTNQLIIYEIDANTIPKCLLKVDFYGELDDIRYVELTLELKTKQLSPIIQTETKRYRYSIKRQCWTLPEYEYKSPFSKPEDNFESLDNVIKNFGFSLLTHNQTLMEKTYLTMLVETPFECTIRLIEYHNAGIKEISGIWLTDVLEHAFNYLQINCPDVVDKVTESEQYKLYLSDIKRGDEESQDNNNNTNISIDNININGNINQNSSMESSAQGDIQIDDNSNSSITSSMNSDNPMTPSNSPTKISKSNKNQIKGQFIKREVPKTDIENLKNRNAFDGQIFSTIKDKQNFYYNFSFAYDDYIERSKKKDPKIDKLIEAATYSSNEQKEIARKMKLKLPSSAKRRSKSVDNDKKSGDDQKKEKKKKRRFIKPEIIQKKSSQQLRFPQQRPLLLSPSYPQNLQQNPQGFNNQSQMQPQHVSKDSKLMNWVLNELKDPKQIDVIRNALSKTQFGQIVQIAFMNQNQKPQYQNQLQPQYQNQSQPQYQNQSQPQFQYQNQSQSQYQYQNQSQPQFQYQNQSQSQFQPQYQNQSQPQSQYQTQSQSQFQSQYQNQPQPQSQPQYQNQSKHQYQNQTQPQHQNQSQPQYQYQNQLPPQSQYQNQLQNQSQQQYQNRSQPQVQSQYQNQSQEQLQDQSQDQSHEQLQDQSHEQLQDQSQERNIHTEQPQQQEETGQQPIVQEQINGLPDDDIEVFSQDTTQETQEHPDNEQESDNRKQQKRRYSKRQNKKQNHQDQSTRSSSPQSESSDEYIPLPNDQQQNENSQKDQQQKEISSKDQQTTLSGIQPPKSMEQLQLQQIQFQQFQLQQLQMQQQLQMKQQQLQKHLSPTKKRKNNFETLVYNFLSTYVDIPIQTKKTKKTSTNSPDHSNSASQSNQPNSTSNLQNEIRPVDSININSSSSSQPHLAPPQPHFQPMMPQISTARSNKCPKTKNLQQKKVNSTQENPQNTSGPLYCQPIITFPASEIQDPKKSDSHDK